MTTTSAADPLWSNTDSTVNPEKSELPKLVDWDTIRGWSITGVHHLWEAANTVADSKACIQQRKFVLDERLHQELREKDGRSYVRFWTILRVHAGVSGRLHARQEVRHVYMNEDCVGSAWTMQARQRELRGG